jgi:Fe-S-cluster containining protein
MSQWFADGLAFRCTQCGTCCTGSQGYVWVSPRDQAAIAAHLGLDLDGFRRRYTRAFGHLLSLVDKPNGDCVFLAEDRRCAIQPVKPRQCLTFPFWPRLTASRVDWEETARRCPGIGGGRRYRASEILAIQDRETPREVLCRILGNERG